MRLLQRKEKKRGANVNFNSCEYWPAKMVVLLSGTSWLIWSQCKCLFVGSAMKPWFAPGQLPCPMGRLLWKDFKALKDTNKYSAGEQTSSLAKVQLNSVRFLSVYKSSFSPAMHLMQMKPEASLVKDGRCCHPAPSTRQVITSRAVSFCCQVAALKTAAKVTVPSR